MAVYLELVDDGSRLDTPPGGAADQALRLRPSVRGGVQHYDDALDHDHSLSHRGPVAPATRAWCSSLERASTPGCRPGAVPEPSVALAGAVRLFAGGAFTRRPQAFSPPDRRNRGCCWPSACCRPGPADRYQGVCCRPDRRRRAISRACPRPSPSRSGGQRRPGSSPREQQQQGLRTRVQSAARHPGGVGGDVAAGPVTRADQWQDSDLLGRAAEPGDPQVADVVPELARPLDSDLGGRVRSRRHRASTLTSFPRCPCPWSLV